MFYVLCSNKMCMKQSHNSGKPRILWERDFVQMQGFWVNRLKNFVLYSGMQLRTGVDMYYSMAEFAQGRTDKRKSSLPGDGIECILR